MATSVSSVDNECRRLNGDISQHKPSLRNEFREDDDSGSVSSQDTVRTLDDGGCSLSCFSPLPKASGEDTLPTLLTSPSPASTPVKRVVSPVPQPDLSDRLPRNDGSAESMRDAYKQLEMAGSAQMNSKKVARLCTDLLFAVVMQNAELETDPKAYSTMLPEEAGVDEHNLSLTQASVRNLQASRENDGAGIEDHSMDVISEVMPVRLRPSSTPNQVMMRKQSTAEGARPADYDLKSLNAACQSRSSSSPPCTKATNSSLLSFADNARAALASADLAHGEPLVSADVRRPDTPAIAYAKSRVRRPVPTRPSSVPANVTFRRRHLRPTCKSPCKTPQEQQQRVKPDLPSAAEHGGQQCMEVREDEHAALRPSSAPAQAAQSSAPSQATFDRAYEALTPSVPAAHLDLASTTNSSSIAETYFLLCRTRYAGMSTRVFTRLCMKSYQECRTRELTSVEFTEACASRIFEMIVAPDRRHIEVQQFEVGVSLFAEKIRVEEDTLRCVVSAVGSPDSARPVAPQHNDIERNLKVSPQSKPASTVETAPWFKRPSFAVPCILVHKPEQEIVASASQPTSRTGADASLAAGSKEVAQAVPATLKPPSLCDAPRPAVPSTPPPALGARPQPRPLGPLALAEAVAEVDTRCEIGIAQPKKLQHSVRRHTFMSLMQDSCSAMAQAPSPSRVASFISPTHSEASTATPTGSAKFESPQETPQVSPCGWQANQANSARVEHNRIAPPGKNFTQLLMATCKSIAENPAEQFMDSPAHVSEVSHATPPGKNLAEFSYSASEPEAEPPQAVESHPQQTAASVSGPAEFAQPSTPSREEVVDASVPKHAPPGKRLTDFLQVICKEIAEMPHKVESRSPQKEGASPAAISSSQAPSPSRKEATRAGVKNFAPLGKKFSELLQVTCSAIAQTPQASLSPSPPSEISQSSPAMTNDTLHRATTEPCLLSPTIATSRSLVLAGQPKMICLRPPSPVPVKKQFRRSRTHSQPAQRRSPSTAPEQNLGTCELANVFADFCGSSRGLSCKGFAKLCKHASVADEIALARDIGLICEQVLPKGKRHMGFQQFENALALLADVQHMDEGTLRRKIVQAGSPKQNGLSESEERRPYASSDGTPSPSCPERATALHGQSRSQSEAAARTLRPLRSLARSTSHGTVLSPTVASHESMVACSPIRYLSEQSPQQQDATPSTSPAMSSVDTATPSVSPAASSTDTASISWKAEVSPDETPLASHDAMPDNQSDAAARTAASPPRSLRSLLKLGMQASSCKRGVQAEAQDALDAALLFRAEATRCELSCEQKKQAKNKSSDALALALLAEARNAGMDIAPIGLQKAERIAQNALDFTFLTDRNLDIDAQWLDELRSHAEDAVQMGLLAIDRSESSSEALTPRQHGKTLEALEEVFHITSRVLRQHLTGPSLANAKQSAREAVSRAVMCEVKCSGLQLTPKQLQQALRRTHAALDSVTLADPDVCATGDFALLKHQALNALQLALLGVKIGFSSQ